MRQRFYLIFPVAAAGLLMWACDSSSFSGSNGRAQNPPLPPAVPVAAPTPTPTPEDTGVQQPAPAPTTDLGTTSTPQSVQTGTTTDTATPAAPAGPAAPLSLTVSCSSSQYQPCQTTQDCASFTVPTGATITAVTLAQQVSDASCDQGSSWSYDTTSLACWAGCRGNFTVTYQPAPASPSP